MCAVFGHATSTQRSVDVRLKGKPEQTGNADLSANMFFCFGFENTFSYFESCPKSKQNAPIRTEPLSLVLRQTTTLTVDSNICLNRPCTRRQQKNQCKLTQQLCVKQPRTRDHHQRRDADGFIVKNSVFDARTAARRFSDALVQEERDTGLWVVRGDCDKPLSRRVQGEDDAVHVGSP